MGQITPTGFSPTHCPLLGDKSWAALFDNSKVTRVAGPFDASQGIDEFLRDSIAHPKGQRKAWARPKSPPKAMIWNG